MPLLALDHENALAGEDDEVLLLFAFSVVEAVRLTSAEDAEREAGKVERHLVQIGSLPQHEVVGLEDADAAEAIVVQPRRIPCIDDEPAGADRRKARADILKACFRCHTVSVTKTFHSHSLELA
jgi:hypothetical protein